MEPGAVARLALGLIAAAVVLITAVAYADCPPGMYEYNMSGQFICIPKVSNTTLPFASVSAYYADAKTVNITLICTGQNTCNFVLHLVNATNGVTLYSTSIAVDPGTGTVIQVPLTGTPTALILNVTVNGIQLPLMAVPPYHGGAVPGIIEQMKANAVLYTFYMMLAFAPPLAAVLRGSTKDAALLLAVTSPITPVIAEYLGLPAPMIYTAVALSLALALILYFVGS